MSVASLSLSAGTDGGRPAADSVSPGGAGALMDGRNPAMSQSDACWTEALAEAARFGSGDPEAA